MGAMSLILDLGFGAKGSIHGRCWLGVRHGFSPEGVGLGAKQIVGGIEGGSTLPFDIMIPWNIVRRIPRERKDGWNLMN